MYDYDDKWILSNPLSLVEFNTESIMIFDCVAIDAEFYDERIRKLVVVSETNMYQRHVDIDPISESFLIQHGEPFPNTMYLGVAQRMCQMDRYFRIISSHVDFSLNSVPVRREYTLAGLPGEAHSVLDKLFSEIENE